MNETHFREIDILTLTDDPARDYPWGTTWVLTPTTDPDIHPDYRHHRYELWAPDPEHPGRGICIARLSDGVHPRNGLLLASALQATWPGIADTVAQIVGAARQGRASGFRSGVWRGRMKEAVDRLNAAHPEPLEEPGHRAITALAQEAVDAMGDVFYDADQYHDETLSCPKCGEEIPVLSTSCPHCEMAFDEAASRDHQIYEHAILCVATAICRALHGVTEGEMEQ